MGLYDAVIVGAGLAGLACASELRGKVLLIDKKGEPYRRIACAEWVSPLLDVKERVQGIKGMITLYPGGEIYSPWRGFIMDREIWQRRKLESLRCEVHLGERVVQVEEGLVRTDRGTYRAEWIIGADGPLSRVRRSMGLDRPRFINALNMRMPLLRPLDETIVAFFPEVRGGYAWCFPRGDVANVGIGMIGEIRKAIGIWRSRLVSLGLIRDSVLEMAWGFIPVGGPLSLIKGRVLLTGDAGGLIDPLTGAGICYAIDSGRMAAGVVKGGVSPEDYAREMELSYGRFFRRRLKRRRLLEERWEDLKGAVESAWIAFCRG